MATTAGGPALRRTGTRLAGEVVVRLVLIGIAIHLLPHVFTGDASHFYRQASRYSLVHLDRMPYRFVPRGEHSYEFPPLTVAFLALQHLSFRSRTAFTWLLGTTMAAFELASLILLRRAWPEHRRGLNRFWYATVVPLGLLAWFRYDFAAVLFATIAFVALERRTRGVVAGIVAGFATKLWPAALIACLAVRRRWRDAAVAAASCGVVLVAWRQFSPTGFGRFLAYREGSGLEVESLPASLRLLGHHGPFRVRSGAWVIDAGHFAWVNPVSTVALVAFVAFAITVAWRAPRADVAALAGALTIGSFLFSRIISAQYLVWPAPFLALLVVRGNRRIAALAAATTVLTFGYLLAFDHALVEGNRWVGGVVLARNLVLVLLLVETTVAIRPRVRASRASQPRRTEGVVGGGGGAPAGPARSPGT